MKTFSHVVHHVFGVGGRRVGVFENKTILTLVTTHVCYMRLRLMRRPLRSEEYFFSQNVDPQYEQQCEKRRLLFICAAL